MRSMVFDIQRGSLRDGPGLRTTVFLKGCPLRCLWCHNPEARSFRPELSWKYDVCTRCGQCAAVCDQGVHTVSADQHIIDFARCNLCGKCVEACPRGALRIIGAEMSLDEVMQEVVADRDFYANSGGGMTLSGGEPLAQFAFSMELLQQAHSLGIHTCVETSGHVPAARFAQALPLIDLLLFDYKITGRVEHKRYTGVSNVLILANLDHACRAGSAVVLRCPIIPGINDSPGHFAAIRDLEQKYPELVSIELLAYHDLGNSKRPGLGVEKTLPDLKTTPRETVEGWLDQLRDLGCKKCRLG